MLHRFAVLHTLLFQHAVRHGVAAIRLQQLLLFANLGLLCILLAKASLPLFRKDACPGYYTSPIKQ